MTRYSSPQPHGQLPTTQGRGAPRPQHGQPADYQPEHWPSQQAPRTGGHHPDPYTALRPDGYGYAPQPQPAADPYGLAGYTAPQPSAAAYASRSPQAPQPAPSYAQPANSYGNGGYAPANAPGLNAPGLSFGEQAGNYTPAAQGYGSPAPQPSLTPGFGHGQANGAHAPVADHWGTQSFGGPQELALDTRDYGHQAYSAQSPAMQPQWPGDYGEQAHEPSLAQGYANGQPSQHGSFDQSYAEDEAQYEDEPRRGGWKKVMMVLGCFVAVGGMLTFAYTSIMAPDTGGPAPVVKSAAGPSKVKPSDPGGKQFAHADSKIMGRLGEGAAAPDADAQGVRKVPVVVVGRDGSIQAPAAQQEQTRAVVAVPGLTVIDGLGGPPMPGSAQGPAAAKAAETVPPVQKVAVKPADEMPAARKTADTKGALVVVPPSEPKAGAAAKPVVKKIAEAKPAQPKPDETGAVPTAKPEKPKMDKVAAADPQAMTAPQSTGAAGYVAVLASVPASGSSRIDALKQFADMQQKYGVILQNKTPDIREANLGEKGTYHRLMVGPPGSRDSASSVCTQLKAEGYSGCWVTAY